MSIVYSIKRMLKYILGRDILPKIVVKKKNAWFGSDYGGFYVADEYLSKDSIVLSFGVGKDITFDLELIDKIGLSVYAFDPTPKTIEWIKEQDITSKFNFFSYGIADYDGYAKFIPPENPEHVSHTILEKSSKMEAIEVPVKCLKTIVDDLEIEKVDLLKMDIEGAEYNVIQDLHNTDIRPKQILLEFHHNFQFIEVHKTKQAIVELEEMGYKLFNYSKNGNEYSFIKID